MEGGGGGGEAAAAPSTAPAREASRAVLLDQRKKEVQDGAAVGSLFKVVYAEEWTTRAGAAMSSGYGKQVPKKKLFHIWGGDKPGGYDPSACQTYRDIDQFLAEPDEEKFFDAIKAYVATCVVSCRVAKEGSSKLQDKWSDFLDDYPAVEELEGDQVFGTIRSQVTICCGMNAAPQRRLSLRLRVVGRVRRQPQVHRARVAAVEAEVYQSSMSTLTSRNSRPCPRTSSQLLESFVTCNRGLATPDARNHTKEAVSDACLMQLRIKDELELWYSNQGGLTTAIWGGLSEAERATKWTTGRCSKPNASVFAKEDYSAVKNY